LWKNTVFWFDLIHREREIGFFENKLGLHTRIHYKLSPIKLSIWKKSGFKFYAETCTLKEKDCFDSIFLLIVVPLTHLSFANEKKNIFFHFCPLFAHLRIFLEMRFFFSQENDDFV
jgi:hypothetical protein